MILPSLGKLLQTFSYMDFSSNLKITKPFKPLKNLIQLNKVKSKHIDLAEHRYNITIDQHKNITTQINTQNEKQLHY